MKSSPPERISALPDAASTLKRRGVLLGTGAAAVAGVAAGLAARSGEKVASGTLPGAGTDEGAGGYRASPHVLRYYATARI